MTCPTPLDRILRWLSLFTLAAGVSAGLAFYWSHRADGQAFAELDTLLARGKEEQAACVAFKKRMDTLLIPRDFPGNAKVHRTRKEALAVLAILENYPGWSPGYAEAADLFYDNAAAFAHNIHQYDLASRRGSIESCEPLTLLRQTQLLLADERQYQFTAREKGRVKAVLDQFLTGEPRFRSLFEGLVKSYVLRIYLESLPDSDPAKSLADQAKAVNDAGEAGVPRLSEVRRAHRGDILQTSARELEMRQVQELFRAYYPLARATFKAQAAPGLDQRI